MTLVNFGRLNLDSYLLELYVFYSALLCLKLLLMCGMVGLARIYFKAVFNEEDSKYGSFSLKEDETVERYRRAHLNDLENIPVFLISSLLFILTNPTYFWALWVFRVYFFTRIGHTFMYCFVKSTVFRIVFYDTGLYINIFIILRILYFFYTV
ncbi:unnamed protein product [Brassicogethes aeneus]|uniref:Microsomal glutathione S-transferase 1 n=1 Tax=Brassicogethes aeneus TaxID=1431903 RepID=A0A9P0FCG9_BRAAE|nr:unnamed protein product [Brassicogethes aeneus]